MFLDDYYWDGKEFRKKDKTLSDLLLGLNALHKITPPPTIPPYFNVLRSRILSKGPTNIWEKFDYFISRLALTPLQKQDAITKANNISRILRNAYYALLQQTLPVYVVVGSHMKTTAIAPPSDIDILFILPNHNFKRFDSYENNGQSALMQEIRSKLINSFPNTEIKADGQAILVPFASYAVEVVPCFRGNNGVFITPDSNDNWQWKLTNPLAEKTLLLKSNVRTKGNTIKLIKMVKAWRDYCSVELKSLVIELRAIYFLEKWPYFDKGSVYYDWMIKDFFAALLNYVDGSCIIPGLEEKIQYGNIWKSKVETALVRAQKACSYESNKQLELAAEEWKKIFGDRFPS